MQDTLTIERQKGAGIHVVSAGVLYRIIADGKETGQRFSLMEAVLQPGQGAPYHIHKHEDEAFFILEGEVTFYLQNRESTVQQEGFVSCPPGAVRGFRNNGDKTARMLLFYSSAGIEEMTVRDGRIVEADAQTHEPAAEHKAQCPQLAEEYGIVELDKGLPQ